MATVTLPHFNVTPTFQNIVATIAGAGSVDVKIQNVGDADVEIVTKASGGAPDIDTTTGMIFRPRESFTFNAAQIWVRTRGGRGGRVSLLTTATGLDLFAPTALFAASEQGIVLDPSDLTSMRELSTGATAAAVGSPVGFIADKRLMGGQTFDAFVASQPELVTNGGPFTTTTGWTAFWSTLSVSGTSLRVTENGTNSANYAQQTITTVAGTWYYITVELTAISGPSKAQLWVGTSAGAANLLLIDGITTPRAITACFLATSTSTVVELVQNATAGGTSEFTEWNNISIKAIPGNHATQATAAARPILRQDGARYYLEFDGVDDSLATASIDFSATDEMSVFAGAYYSTPTASTGALVELSVTVAANSGSFTVFLPDGSNRRLWLNGGGLVGLTNAVTLPQTDVFTGLYDISGTPEIVMRVDGVQVASTSGGATGNFGNYPLYIGSRGGSALRFNGRIYSLIVRGKLPDTDEQRDQTETYVAGKTGVVL